MVCCPRSMLLSSAGLLLAGALVAASTAHPPASPAAAARPEAGSFKIDPVHSSVIFRIQHMGVSFFYGRFDKIAGQIALDADDPSKSSVEITIDAQSLDTNNAKRDDDVRGPDLLNASEFPEIGFKSEAVKPLDGGKFEVAGQLSFHGETKPLTVQVEQTGLGKASHGGGTVAGFETTFTIKRSDYGMDAMIGMLGDEVRLTVSVEAHGK